MEDRTLQIGWDIDLPDWVQMSPSPTLSLQKTGIDWMNPLRKTSRNRVWHMATAVESLKLLQEQHQSLIVKLTQNVWCGTQMFFLFVVVFKGTCTITMQCSWITENSGPKCCTSIIKSSDLKHLQLVLVMCNQLPSFLSGNRQDQGERFGFSP